MGRGLYATQPGMRRLSHVEQFSAARGMHGWMQRPHEPGDQDAALAWSPAARERSSRSEPGGGRKRATEQAPADGAHRQQKRDKVAKDAEGGSQPEDPPPPPDTPPPEREPRSGVSAPSPAFFPLIQEGMAAAPSPHHPPPQPAGNRQRV